jgi:hypothetical protein
LIAVIPLRSPLRGETTKIPMTAVITPDQRHAQWEDQAVVAKRALAQELTAPTTYTLSRWRSEN